jgi:hypothetical protein
VPNLSSDIAKVVLGNLHKYLDPQLPQTNTKWQKVPIFDVLLQVTLKSSNRAFFGDLGNKEDALFAALLRYFTLFSPALERLRMFPPFVRR